MPPHSGRAAICTPVLSQGATSRHVDLGAQSKSEFDAIVGEALAYDEVLRKSGHFLAGRILAKLDAVAKEISAEERSFS